MNEYAKWLLVTMPANKGRVRPSHHPMPISIVLLSLDARPAAVLAIGHFASTAILRPIHDPKDGNVWRWCLRHVHAAGRA